MSDATKQAILEMLTENTGRNMLDSGGTPKYDENGKYIGSTSGYGRAFERNAGLTIADLDTRPSAVLDAHYGELSVTLDLYHWLIDRLDYEPELTALYDAWAAARDGHHIDLMLEFPAVVAGYQRFDELVANWCGIAAGHWVRFGERAADQYRDAWGHPGEIPDDALADGEAALQRALLEAWREDGRTRVWWEEGDEPPEAPDIYNAWGDSGLNVYNSYNDENALSQDIQFAIWYSDRGGDVYVTLQIHGGADARGGYTAPRIFSLRDEPSCMFDYNRVSLQAPVEDAPTWDSDNGGYDYETTIYAHNNLAELKPGDWTTLRIDRKTLVIDDVPVDMAPLVAQLAAAWYSGDPHRLLPRTEEPDLFGGTTTVYGKPPDGIEDATHLLVCHDGYTFGDFALVTDDEGNAYCPVTGGKLEAWG